MKFWLPGACSSALDIAWLFLTRVAGRETLAVFVSGLMVRMQSCDIYFSIKERGEWFAVDYDLVVLGGGPGGYKAALKAAQNGLKTALVEKAGLGGTCLNRGCVPTKLFLGATSVLAGLESQKKLKLATGQAVFDLQRLQARKDSIINASQNLMRVSLEKTGVQLFNGRGRLRGGKTVRVEDRELSFTNLILATGSESGALPGLKPDHEYILTSTDALCLTAVPRSMIVIGAGAVGLEIGQIFHRLGTRITMIEALDRVAPMEDREVSVELFRYLKRQGMDIRTGVRVKALSIDNALVRVCLEGREDLEAEKCLLALGRLPDTDSLNLEAEGVQTYGPGWIKADSFLGAADNIYAIGDVNGRSLYAHSAEHQGEYVLEHILGRDESPYDPGPVPSCIYGSLEVIRTGLGSQELTSAGETFSVSSASLAPNTIIQSHGLIQGFIKVFWVRDRVAGITGVGHGLSGLITLAQIATRERWTRKEAGRYIFAHPTLDESLREALLGPQIKNEPGS